MGRAAEGEGGGSTVWAVGVLFGDGGGEGAGGVWVVEAVWVGWVEAVWVAASFLNT